MIRRHLLVALLGFTTITTACHHKPPAPAPTPAATPPPPPPAAPDTSALHARHVREQFVADSTAAAEQAKRDAAARAAAGLANARASMADMIHFEYNKSDISPEDARKLDAKIAVMKAHPALKIRITGNCDERGSDDYNIALGSRRAAAARDYLVRAGIDASRIDVATLGREKPLDPGHDEAAWAKNRRDEFEVIAGQQTLGN